MRIATVQFSPLIGRVADNLARAKELTASLQPDAVDLVCLPEMAFTGYMFPDSSSVSPHLELPQQGPTSLFCKELATRLRCYVTAGYPELLDAGEDRPENTVGANSSVFYGPDGTFISNYRKTNLFPIDKPWAKPGTGFVRLSLPNPIGTMALGICMDLNPVDSEKSHIYELASYTVVNNANILVLICAWKDSGDYLSEATDVATIRFWIKRCRPLAETSDGKHGKETVVVVCNRTGYERGTQFAGSSSVFRFGAKGGPPEVLGSMGRNEEGVKVWDI